MKILIRIIFQKFIISKLHKSVEYYCWIARGYWVHGLLPLLTISLSCIVHLYNLCYIIYYLNLQLQLLFYVAQKLVQSPLLIEH